MPDCVICGKTIRRRMRSDGCVEGDVAYNAKLTCGQGTDCWKEHLSRVSKGRSNNPSGLAKVKSKPIIRHIAGWQI